MIRLFFLLTGFLAIVPISNAQERMSSSEMSYLYNADHEFLVDYRLAESGNQVKVYLRFTLNSGSVSISDYVIRYDLRENYISEKKTGAGLRLDSSHVVASGFRELYYLVELERSDAEHLLALEIENVVRNRKYFLDIPLVRKSGVRYQPFLLFDTERDIPYFSRYINAGTDVRIRNVFGEGNGYEIRYGIQNASPALPPFDETPIDPSNEILFDSVLYSQEGERFTFGPEGVYKIRGLNDTLSDNHLCLFVANSFFPQFGDYPELIDPLIYISTDKEFKDLKSAENTREQFENFVLRLVKGNQEVAKDFVKYYFKRTKRASHYFTTSKEGWKTDKGMLYQIFGNPVQVFRNEATELWVYSFPNSGRIRFLFDIVKGDYHQEEYRLIHNKKFREQWMSAVTKWRSGQVIE